MNIKKIGLFDTGKIVPLAEYIATELDGADIERGQLETIERTTNNAAQCLANLIERLVDFGVLKVEGECTTSDNALIKSLLSGGD